MEEDIPQPSTVPQVENMDSHMRNDSLVTVRLSEPVQLKIDTTFEPKEEDDQREQDGLVTPEDHTILEGVEEDEQEEREDGVRPEEHTALEDIKRDNYQKEHAEAVGPEEHTILEDVEGDGNQEEQDEAITPKEHTTLEDVEEDQREREQDEQDDAVMPEEYATLEDVEEEEQVVDRLSRSSGISTVNPSGQSLAAELGAGNLSTLESRRLSGISNNSTIKAEDHNMATEFDDEDLSAIESQRGSKLSRLNTINLEEEGSPMEDEIKDSFTSVSRRGSNESEDGEVNWVELQKNEADEPKDEGSEDSTALLLARLEQENNILATNPKAGLAQASSSTGRRPRGQSRPPSMQQLKKMVNQPPLPSLRYSLIATPPMTDLEFYAALVKDYPKTLRKLPTLVSKKIRGGVPPPLRGVVWQSMAGSRDPALEEQYERLSGETSPYEGIIGKDLGRSFPGVEMFRDPEGDGQRMLGRVLKCFSLYDQKIGYCQGLGFLVGPLLMHMPDKEAFCLLVKLMEHYGLRESFVPDLSGLHVRIYQFRTLLKQHLPTVSAHLDHLQIEPAYVSQWFLSFFATTCPLPMLFRIFDVIFAEGASETIMRVALSLMRKNEAKIVACTELEDVMQLLLSRELFDPYRQNGDELVNDFVTFSGVVTHDTLQTLEAAYNDSRAEVRSSDIGSVATRFLGRLWIGSTASSTKSTPSLSPGLSAPARPGSFLRRSPSKQSIASTLNSIEGGSDSIMSASTDATTVSRDSSNTDNSSIRTESLALGNNKRKTAMSTMSKMDADLHGQIEDLLTAMSEMQRENAQLETQLQREREEREEDRVTVGALLSGLTRKSRMEALQMVEGDIEKTDINGTALMANTDVKDFAKTEEPPEGVDLSSYITAEELSSLLDSVEDRFQTEKDNRRSSVLQSKHQLRDELARSKEQLANEVSKAQDLARRLAAEEQEVSILRDQLRESHAHIRTTHGEKQRLERQVSELRQAARNRQSPTTSPDGSEVDGGWSSRSSTFSGGSVGGSGLRELKLGRSNSTRSTKTTFSKRTSSLHNPLAHAAADAIGQQHEASSSVSSIASTAPTSPNPSNIADNEALILELVQAKTAKVMAEQEVEEMKIKLESLRKMIGKSGDGSVRPSIERTATQGSFMSYMGRSASTSSVETKASVSNGAPTIVATPPSKEATPEAKPTAPAPATGLGGFWGGWGKKA